MISKEEIVSYIGSLSSEAEALLAYSVFHERIPEYKFIFASEKGGIPGLAVNHSFPSGGYIRSLFKTERILVLDPQTFRDMKFGQATYPIDYSISLDTQALSYLVPYIKTGKAVLGFDDVFNFISRLDVNVDPSPYMGENLFRLNNKNELNKIFEKIKYYEILRNIDSDHYATTKEIQCTLNEMELNKSAQNMISRMYMDLNNVPFTNEKSKMYMTLYACILAMVSIHLGSISKNIFEKLISFLEFCDDTLSVMMARELLLAKKYFEKGHVLGFFKYIQKNRQGILEKIRNMSWDLCHIRLMEKSITINPTGESRYFFPALLTFDRDLIEVIDLYPLKSCVFKNDGSDLRLFFDGSLLEELSGNEDDRNIICERFYSNEAIQKRSANRAQAEKRLPRIIKEFEERVCKNAQVSS